METVDRVNQQFGSGTVQYAVAGLQQPLGMKSYRRSPRWTTEWGDPYRHRLIVEIHGWVS